MPSCQYTYTDDSIVKCDKRDRASRTLDDIVSENPLRLGDGEDDNRVATACSSRIQTVGALYRAVG